MRALLVSCALMGALALPLAAQNARFLKVDIVEKSAHHGHHRKDGPSQIHIRVPVALAKGLLEVANTHGSVKINGECRQDIHLDQLVKLLETAKPGDLLVEITSDEGDLVKVAVE